MRSKLLKVLAVLSFGLITLPFILTNDVLAFDNIDVLRVSAYYAVFFITFLLGYLFGKAALKHKRLLLIERIIGVLTFSAGFILLPFTGEINIITAVGLSAVLWYFLGERATKKHYADIFPAFMFGVYIGVTLLSYLFFSAMCESEVKEPVLNAVSAMFMVELCFAALLINQSGIYDKANRRKETRTMLPKGLSGYNAALVLGITVIGLFLYLFKDRIVRFLNETVRLAVYAALFLIKGEAEFMAIESGDSSGIGSGYYPPETNDAWNIIFIILLITVIIIFRKKVLSFIKDIFKRIYGFFVKETLFSSPEPEFTDVFEEIGSSRKERGENLTYSKLLKLYKNENDMTKKYRLGYRILLKQLKGCKTGINNSDTVTVHHEKGRDLCGVQLKAVTDSYDRVRYDNKTVTKDELIKLDNIIKELNGLLKGKIL